MLCGGHHSVAPSYSAPTKGGDGGLFGDFGLIILLGFGLLVLLGVLGLGLNFTGRSMDSFDLGLSDDAMDMVTDLAYQGIRKGIELYLE